MIHNTLGQTINIIGTTEESRINTTVPTANLRFLVKFTNEYSGSILYAYGTNVVVKSRFTKMDIAYSTTNSIYSSRINLNPVGYWKYEIFEVSYISAPESLDSTNAPSNENEVLTVSDENGVVEGRVDIGKINVVRADGTNEVEFTENISTEVIYIYAPE